MKRSIKAIAITAIITISAASCQNLSEDTINQVGTDVPEGQQASLKVGVEGPRCTRASGVTSTSEQTISNLQVFIFRGDNLDAYGRVEGGGKSVELGCTSGKRYIIAVANAPSLSSIASKAELLSASSKLSDNATDRLVMIGIDSLTVQVGTNPDKTVDISRIASRIVLKKISTDFKAPALAAQTFEVERIYVVNAAGSHPYDLTRTPAPSIWYNKLSDCSEQSQLLKDEVSKTIANGSSHTHTYTYYTYPNPTQDDVNGGEWSARRTRLVIQAKLGGQRYYYPVTMPVMESGKSYELDDMVITTPGSDSPDTPVSYLSCTFKVNIIDWEVTPLSYDSSK